MTRKSGTHFCDKVMLKLLIWRIFLSIRRFRLIGICYNAMGAGHHGSAAKQQVFRVNSLGAENLARLCNAQALPFLTFSADRVHAALDLLIDAETGLWHLSNREAVPLPEFAELFAIRTQQTPRIPKLVVLGSERGSLMPSLKEALTRHKDLLAAVEPKVSCTFAAE